MKKAIFVLLVSLLNCIIVMSLLSQIPNLSPFPGELLFEVVNPPSQFSVTVSVSHVGMLFSGDDESQCPQPKVYSYAYTNVEGADCNVLATQSITGASRTLSNTTMYEWALQHIGDGSPKKLSDDGWNWEWIGYGVYKIEIEADDSYTFYIDFLDSNYPYTAIQKKDIFVVYDFSKPLGKRVVLSSDIGVEINDVNGKLFTVWKDLFLREIRATEFYLHGIVPLENLSSDELFCSVIVDDDITVPNSKNFIIDPASYPGTTLPDISLKFAANKKVTVNGALTVKGTNNKFLSFDRSGSSGGWGGIQFNSGSTGSLEYATIQRVQTYGGAAITLLSSSPSIQRCTLTDNVNYGTSGIYVSGDDPEIHHNTITNNGGYGITYNSSSGNVYANIIDGNSSGAIYCYNYSYPSFGKIGFPAYNGNNTLTNGAYGIKVYNHSAPYVGSQSNSQYFGHNSVQSVFCRNG